VVKPISVREVVLRVGAIMRRLYAQASPAAPISTFGALRLDTFAHRVWVGNHEVRLTAIEFELLGLLVSRCGRTQTRSALLRDVWRVEARVTTRTVDTHVKRLREKLGEVGRNIATVRGVGYRSELGPAGT
jgi:two-component system phosphate regulon response regulator PhoB